MAAGRMAQAMTRELIEAADRWLVPMAGLTVMQCRVDYAFSLIAADGLDGWFEVRIEQPFVVASPGKELLLDPAGEPAAMAPALSVLHQTVVEAVAFKDGRLELMFGDGRVLRVPIGKDHEAWNVVGPGGLQIVSLPGGELAIWSPDADAR